MARQSDPKAEALTLWEYEESHLEPIGTVCERDGYNSLNYLEVM